MGEFTLRAEAKSDIDTLMDQLVSAKYPISAYRIAVDGPLEDPCFQFSTTATLDEVLAVIRKVPDGHIMHRTLREGSLCPDQVADYARTDW